jgi:hypothetical protein
MYLASTIVIGVLAVGGCSKGTAPAAGATATPAAAAESQAPAGGAAPAQAAAAGATAQTVTGTVLETMNAANYTYVRVKTTSGEVWAATSQFKVAVGDKIIFAPDTPMQNFHSQSLNRDFPLIYFVGQIGREGETLSAPNPMMAAHAGTGPAVPGAGGAAAAEKPEPPIKVDPAPGGMSIGDVWSKRKTLIGKTITLRGKVVKFTGGVLGVNWIHIQDGTGSAKDNTNDITMTSTDTVKLGDVITATGTIILDKDLGSGYSYPVLLDKAKLVVV